MECPRQKAELILSYAAGTLEPSAQIEFERHLASCESCRQLLMRQQTVWEALDVWHGAPVSSGFSDKLYERIAEHERASWWRRTVEYRWSRLLRPVMPVAAASAAILIAFLVKAPLQSPNFGGPAEPAVSMEQVERALDDMDMLKPLSTSMPPAGMPAPAARNQRI